MVGDVLRWLADQVDPPKPREYAPYPPRLKRSAFAENEGLDEQRREDALSLVDPETLGYVMVVVRDQGAHATLEPGVALLDEMWPALKDRLVRLVLEGDRAYRYDSAR